MIINQMGTIKFQLTPSRRATAAAPTIMQIIHFNSRPHGGRRAFRMYMDAMKHFNSRPHGGRHFDVQLVQSI